jgi:hypothetical protein
VLRLMSEEYPERYQVIEDYLEQFPNNKQIIYTTEERRSTISKRNVYYIQKMKKIMRY